MPIFDYKCNDCGKVSEMLIRSGNIGEVRCPDCAGSMEKLISSSYLVKMGSPTAPGTTCCGREERCETPSCSTGERCQRH